MMPTKILSIVDVYTLRLLESGVTAKRIDVRKSFAQLNTPETLAHALYLCENIRSFVHDTKKVGKSGRHLASIQMCLSFAGWYSLEEVMEHNRPD